MSLPNVIAGVVTGLEWLLALGWCWRLVDWLRHASGLTDLTRGPFQPIDRKEVVTGGGEPAPDLTVIVPACNEAESIEATLRSLLESEGIRLQVLAVDDRSTDETGALMERCAEEYRRRESTSDHAIEVIHIKELPNGWLGKPHALATGARAARAEWLLFTDGDIFFDREALGRALRCARERQADQLVLMPQLILGSAGEAAMHGMMYSFSLWGFTPWQVENAKSKSFLGVGAFNLMRRSSYEQIGGFEGLRMEVLEDMRLGWTVKRSGLRPVVAVGPELVRVRWAKGAWGVVRNTEKNLFALYRFQTAIALAGSFALSLQLLLPLAALCVGGPFAMAARAAVVVHALAIAGLYFATRRITRVSPVYALLFPLALGLFVFAHLRSIGLALWRGGILWRGTLYPLATLRAMAGSWK